ncbi:MULTISPECIES: GNAT family N-acetyltransferase [Shimia]|uniref:GNAT family N-acetyltransferase n=1 Tax=Shimia TaxID=573139 RepID=UPI001FB4AC89|nr:MULTISPECIES: GNAT family N-acetyltransferase [Shimia]MDV4145707.1 GNAT family N-acetyltransferase [Shimia sp. FJ5]
MTTALHLARPEHIEALLPLVAAFHEEAAIVQSEEMRRAAIQPLLDGSPLGAVYLIGPRRAPIGYIVVTFGWSVEFGGMDAFVDELYIRRAVRGRGIATEVLSALPLALGQAGVRAIHLEVDQDNTAAQKLYTRSGFRARDRYMLMTRKL